MWNFEATTVLACFEKLKSRFELIGRSSGVGGEGASAPQSFDLSKIRAKFLKIWAKSVKIFTKSLKIWANSLKIRAKMAPNVCRIT